MTNRSRSVRRHGKWLVVAPVSAAALAVTMTACSNSEEPAPKDAVYTTPAPFIGSTPSEQAPVNDSKVAGFKAALIGLNGGPTGTAVFGDDEQGLDVTLNIVGSPLEAGIYQVGITDNGQCNADGAFASAGELRTFGSGTGPTTLSVPVSADGSGTLDTSIPNAEIHRLVDGAGSAVVVLDDDGARQACGIIRPV